MSNRLGKYICKESLMHNMNSVFKIICTIIYAIFIFVSYDIRINIAMCALLVLLLLLSRVPIFLYFKPIWEMKWFLLFIFIINIIFGNDVFITIMMVSKIIMVLLYTMMVLYTTKKNDIIYGLQVVFSPLKVLKIPVNKMAFSVSLAIRFIPDLINIYDGLIKAQKNRGIDLKSLNFKNRIDILGKTITSIFITCLKKADELADMMEIRMYDINKALKRKFTFDVFGCFVLMIHISLIFLIIESVMI